MNESPGESGDERAPCASLELINSICDRFEDAWLGGEPPPELSSFLQDVHGPDRNDLFRHLLELDIDYRSRSGSTPALGEYLDRFPEHAPVVRRVFQPTDVLGGPPEQTQEFVLNGPVAASIDFWSPHPLPKIPGYVILSELGRGGMGVVYKARHRDLNRVVALKMIAGVSTYDQRSRVRFRIEAEAIARLQHSHIVQIFEVGEDVNGTPYLALEFVDGGNLYNALDGNPWPVEPTVRFLTELAETIDHAHNRQVVHRDLKPANILLVRPVSRAVGEVVQFKVSDFGLAKQLDAGPGATNDGEVIGTPAFMAPEQFLADRFEVGPWTDVYAIGVIAYELLTARLPYQANTAHETFRLVLDTDPAPPRRLNPDCPRDLETIVLKCLEKNPDRRYTTAADLARDLRRFREHRPISARPAGPREAVVKWARRNPSRAGLVGLILLTLALAVGGTAVHLQQLRTERAAAERNAVVAVRAVNEMLIEVAVEQLTYEPRMGKKRRAMLDKARVLYETLLRERPGDGEVRRLLAIGFRYLADVARQLGDLSEAEGYYAQAIERLTDLLNGSTDVELRTHLGEANNFLGEVHRLSGRPGQARESYDRAIEIQKGLITDDPADPVHRLRLGRSHDNRALALLAEEELDPALNESTDAVALLRALSAADPRPAHRHLLARARLNQGVILRRSGAADPAEEAFREAAALLEVLSRDDPSIPDYRHELAAALGNLGNLLAATPDRRDEAKQAQHRAADLFRTLGREYPSIPVYRQELANSLNSLGVTLVRGGDRGPAVDTWQEAAEILRELAAESPETADYRSRLGTTLGNVARLHLLMGEYAEARDRYTEAIGLVTAFLQVNSREPAYLGAWRSQHLGLADALIHLDEVRTAVQVARGLPTAIPDPDRGRHLALCFLARCIAVRTEVGGAADRERSLALLMEAAREQYAVLRQDRDADGKLQADPAFAPLAGKL